MKSLIAAGSVVTSSVVSVETIMTDEKEMIEDEMIGKIGKDYSNQIF